MQLNHWEEKCNIYQKYNFSEKKRVKNSKGILTKNQCMYVPLCMRKNVYLCMDNVCKYPMKNILLKLKLIDTLFVKFYKILGLVEFKNILFVLLCILVFHAKMLVFKILSYLLVCTVLDYLFALAYPLVWELYISCLYLLIEKLLFLVLKRGCCFFK